MKTIPAPADPGLPLGEPLPRPEKTAVAESATAAYESLKKNELDAGTNRRLTGRLDAWPLAPDARAYPAHS